MSDTTAGATDVAFQYSARIADDLEHIQQEQVRLTAEIEAMQDQLAALQQDRDFLVTMRQGLGVPSAAPVESPAPAKRKDPAVSRTRKPAGATKSPAPAGKRTVKKKVGKAPVAPSASPTLVDLIREHLAEQSEPRSAVEITTVLRHQNPEHAPKATAVRRTLEELTAENKAQRTKSGNSVFYTGP
ncbi:hypothetical protein [Streptomyces sp. NPDC057694]|uniref:hypothetical protein n=1 Tax=Streptomyces sp. NPDC057694 TaxID=3346216 RepID=UPI00368C0899